MALTPLALASAAGALRVADDDAAVEAHFTSLSNSWNKATLSVERESKQEGRFLGLSKVQGSEVMKNSSLRTHTLTH